jgi:hypothetical protein
MTSVRPEQVYEDDSYAWTQAQAKEQRRFAWSRPHLPPIAEEIADLGKSQHDSLSRTPRRPTTASRSP